MRYDVLAAIPDSPAKAAGLTVGQVAAAAMIAAHANDGSSPAAFYLPTSTDAGIRSGQFRLGPPPTLGSDRYTRMFDEVKAVGSTTSTQQPARSGPRGALPCRGRAR